MCWKNLTKISQYNPKSLFKQERVTVSLSGLCCTTHSNSSALRALPILLFTFGIDDLGRYNFKMFTILANRSPVCKWKYNGWENVYAINQLKLNSNIIRCSCIYVWAGTNVNWQIIVLQTTVHVWYTSVPNYFI